MFNDFAMAVMNLQLIEMASDQVLISITQNENVNQTKYFK